MLKILVLLFVSSFLSVALAQSFDVHVSICSNPLSQMSDCHDDHESAENTPASSPHHDCGDAHHRVNCCTYSHLMWRDDVAQFMSLEFDLHFREGNYIVKPDPVLEGPFQPPRT